MDEYKRKDIDNDLDADLIDFDAEEEEPDPEDFLAKEVKPPKEKKKRGRRRIGVKLIASLVAFMMIFQVFSAIPSSFPLQAADFLETSNELSQRSDVQSWKETVVTVQGAAAFDRSRGTGFFVAEEGWVVTNRHVVEDIAAVVVETDEGDLYEAEEIYISDTADLAFVKLQAEETFPTISFAAENASLQDEAYVVGNPLGFTRVANEGEVISSNDEQLLISTPIYSGNSGSPVLNEAGEAVGVVYASRTGTDGRQGIAVSRDQVFEEMPEEVSLP
ncbi:trypsin-like peptidase [Salsuginibacillus halophilus]|uniref:Trypsin-like peptidase n=1 Tax=Salsuginibacillus halophilus TaxID=517424 RepID=A0A2P8HWL1_9BACI|nr:serine protease [Salsuginibacillus halophilus]PSL50626.1 trypsin-like peptidase [Salsuginibacillus halophilus]